MKILPSLGLVTLCAAFAGCAATTQNISFISATPEQDGVTVVCDGKEIGTTPFVYEVERTQQPAVMKLEFKKNGYRSEESILESMQDVDGLCTFIDEISVPELMAEEPVPAAEEPAPEPAVAEEPAPAEEPADVVPEAEEEPAPAEEPEATEEPAPAAEEPEVAEEPASEPAPEPAVSEEPVPADEEPAPEPAPAEEPAPEPAPEATPADADNGGALDRNRTLVDIQNDLKSYTEQRQSGQISEKEFQKLCAELEKEVRLRYGSK